MGIISLLFVIIGACIIGDYVGSLQLGIGLTLFGYGVMPYPVN